MAGALALLSCWLIHCLVGHAYEHAICTGSDDDTCGVKQALTRADEEQMQGIEMLQTKMSAIAGEGDAGETFTIITVWSHKGAGECIDENGDNVFIGWSPCTCDTAPFCTHGNCKSMDQCQQDCEANPDCGAVNYRPGFCWLFKQLEKPYDRTNPEEYQHFNCSIKELRQVRKSSVLVPNAFPARLSDTQSQADQKADRSAFDSKSDGAVKKNTVARPLEDTPKEKAKPAVATRQEKTKPAEKMQKYEAKLAVEKPEEKTKLLKEMPKEKANLGEKTPKEKAKALKEMPKEKAKLAEKTPKEEAKPLKEMPQGKARLAEKTPQEEAKPAKKAPKDVQLKAPKESLPQHSRTASQKEDDEAQFRLEQKEHKRQEEQLRRFEEEQDQHRRQVEKEHGRQHHKGKKEKQEEEEEETQEEKEGSQESEEQEEVEDDEGTEAETEYEGQEAQESLEAEDEEGQEETEEDGSQEETEEDDNEEEAPDQDQKEEVNEEEEKKEGPHIRAEVQHVPPEDVQAKASRHGHSKVQVRKVTSLRKTDHEKSQLSEQSQKKKKKKNTVESGHSSAHKSKKVKAEKASHEESSDHQKKIASAGKANNQKGRSSEHKKKASSTKGESGQTASLDEDGYQAVVALHDQKEMASFMRRSADLLNLEVHDKARLAEVAQMYDGDREDATFINMLLELEYASRYDGKDKWITPKVDAAVQEEEEEDDEDGAPR